MRRLTTLLLLAAMLSAGAQTLSETEASQKALAFFSYQPRELSLVEEQAGCYYVYNVGHDEGFVIIAADRRARSVLAYSDSGHFDSRNPASEAWLQMYAAQMGALKEAPAAGSGVHYPEETVAPLITSKWDQGEPYNRLCPIDEKSSRKSRSLTGCVATTMAQLMYFYKWPARPTGSISYTDNLQQQARSMNFDEQPAFDWEQMLPRYTAGSYTEAQAQAVARLMLVAAYASQMSFSSSVSTANLQNGGSGMMKYLGYDSHMHRYERIYMTDQQWIDVLTAELRAGRPVMYRGSNASQGHAFVCDGYDGNGLFHFNWGWSGASDGYYSLSALDPKQQGLGGSDRAYNMLQAIECMIQPPSETARSQEDGGVLMSTFAIDQIGREYYSELTALRTEMIGIGFRLSNIGHEDLHYDVCAAVTVDGLFMPVTNIVQVDVPTGYNSKVTTWFNGIDGLGQTTSTVKLYYRQRGSSADWLPLPVQHGGTVGLRVATSSNEYHISAVKENFHLSLRQMPAFGTVYAGKSRAFTLPLLNDGEVTLERKVGFVLRNTADGSSKLLSELAYCSPGDGVDVKLELDLSGMAAGDYQLIPFYSTSTSITAAPTLETIQSLGDTLTFAAADYPLITIEQMPTGYTLDKTEKTVTVDVFQPSARIPWNGRIMAKVLRKTGSGNADREDTGLRLYSEPTDIPRPAIVKVKLYAEEVTLSTGNGYEIVFYIDDGYDIAMYSQTLTITDAFAGIALPQAESALPHSQWQPDGRPAAAGSRGLRIVRYRQGTQIITKKIIDKP